MYKNLFCKANLATINEWKAVFLRFWRVKFYLLQAFHDKSVRNTE